MKNVLIKLPALLLIACILTLSFAACGKEPSPLDVYEEDTDTEKKDMYYVAMNVRDYGVMIFLLDAQNSPITVENFKKLVSEGFYDGLIFHRIIEGFMIQGGGFDENYEQKEADSIKGEFLSNGVNNPIKHTRGVISMARADDFNSATSQFFIVHQDSPHLNGKYAAFGHVVKGIEVVDAIASVNTNYLDMPLVTITIESITFTDYNE